MIVVKREDQSVFINRYKIVRKIGAGFNSKVYLSSFQNKYYAVKLVYKAAKKSSIIKSQEVNDPLVRIRNEIRVLRLLDHKNVLKMHDVLQDDDKIVIVLEYCMNGELKIGQRYSKPRIKEILSDVVSGLLYVHSKGIVHRDIKPSNLLIDGNNSIKISDFGISCFVSEISKDDNMATIGTPAFIAPEVLSLEEKTGKIGFEVDLWSVGVTLYCLYYGKLPFNGNNEYELYNDILSRKHFDLFDGGVDDNDGFNDLVMKLLEKKADKRMKLENIMKHRFMRRGNMSSSSRSYDLKSFIASAPSENTSTNENDDTNDNDNDNDDENNELRNTFRTINEYLGI